MAFAKKYNLPLHEKNENGSDILSFYISGEKENIMPLPCVWKKKECWHFLLTATYV